MYLTVKTLVVALVAIVYGLLAWFVPSWVGLTGHQLWALRILLFAVGLIVLGVVLWWLHGKEKENASDESSGIPTGGGSADDIEGLLRAAESKLRASKVQNARIGNLPVLYLIGQAGAGKTSAALNCGLEPEHLAGQLLQDGSAAPTESVNLWFARQAVLVEAAASVIDDSARWTYVIRRTVPARLRSVFGGSGQAPRAIVVCLDCEILTKSPSMDAITVAAKALQARLREASKVLGANLPVYALFTKADTIPFFAEYAATLSNAEAAQVLGVTLPVEDYRTGLYVQDQTQRLTAALAQISYSLGDHRAEFLAREQDPERLPGIYEFPREFGKLRPAIVQMLVELCRPSQLSVGPFLRGFYFTGVRMVLEESRPASARPLAAPASVASEPVMPAGATQIFDARQFQQAARSRNQPEEPPAGATRVFDVRSMMAGEGGVSGGTILGGSLAQPEPARWVPQWSFISHIFGDLILKDGAALGASGTSTKVGFWQRFLWAAAAAIFLVLSVGFIVSYLGNRDLVSRTKLAESAAFAPVASSQAPDVRDLQRLDENGKLLDTLGGYHRDGRPFFSLGWGLYTGDDLYPRACKAYAGGFRQLLLQPTQASMAVTLKALNYQTPASAPPAKGRIAASAPPPQPYDEPYNLLKTYLISTDQASHAKEDPNFASDLFAAWRPGQNASPDQRKLAQDQFNRYAAALVQPDAAACFGSRSDPDAVTNARHYLNSFPPAQRVYQAMLTDAAKGGKDINFNRDFPGSEKNIINTHAVPAAFTPTGWKGMQEAFQHPQRYVGGESWVLGEGTKEVADAPSLLPTLKTMYHDDFVGQWKAFLKASRFTGYKGDEQTKIQSVAGAQSPLFMTFCLTLKNTSFDVPDKEIQNIFSPARLLEAPDCEDKPAGAGSKDYTEGLFALGACLQKIDQAASPADKDSARASCRSTASDLQLAVRKLVGENAGPDSDANGDVQNLLMAPILELQGHVAAPPPEGAKGLCTAIKMLSAKFPSDATLDDFEGVFKPGAGLLDKFKPPTEKANPHYVSFYTGATGIKKALYPDDKTLQLHYKITVLSAPGVSDYSLTIGSQTLTQKNGPSKDFVWTGDSQEKIQLIANGISAPPQAGSFDVFKFVTVNGDPGTLSGQKYRFDIPVVVGRETPTSPRLHMSIEAGAATELFAPGALAKLGCTPNVGE